MAVSIHRQVVSTVIPVVESQVFSNFDSPVRPCRCNINPLMNDTPPSNDERTHLATHDTMSASNRRPHLSTVSLQILVTPSLHDHCTRCATCGMQQLIISFHQLASLGAKSVFAPDRLARRGGDKSMLPAYQDHAKCTLHLQGVEKKTKGCEIKYLKDLCEMKNEIGAEE